jgi:hypothetical protein
LDSDGCSLLFCLATFGLATNGRFKLGESIIMIARAAQFGF